MFESKGKKELNVKYNKLQGIATQSTNGHKRRKSVFKVGGESGESNTVYGELKLSEKLNMELSMSKEIIMNL